MKTKLTTLLILLAAAVLASACGSAANAQQGGVKSALTQEEAASMIDSALQAINTGDYAAWSHDWVNDLKAAINDAAFQEYRRQVVSQYGQYVALKSVEMQPGSRKDSVRWVDIADFEKPKIKFTFAFPDDGSLVSGVFPDSVE